MNLGEKIEDWSKWHALSDILYFAKVLLICKDKTLLQAVKMVFVRILKL